MKTCPFCGDPPVALSVTKSYEQSVQDRWRCENLDCGIAGLTMTTEEWETRADDRTIRHGLHLFEFAASLGWKDGVGEGAMEFVTRRCREVAFEDASDMLRHYAGLSQEGHGS